MIIVTIPAYNEALIIARIIKKIREVMHKNKYKFKVLVVDDGSTDNTPSEAKKAGAIVIPHPKNYGLAETFRTEINHCLRLKADIIVHIDADGQYLASEIPKLIKEVQLGNDLVLGSRFKGHIEEMPFLKKLGNKAFSRAISKIINLKISDCQTGFRAFNKKVAKEINIQSNHTYTQEQIIKAVNQKFKIKEIPVYFAKRIDGKSRLLKHPFEYALKAWINIFRIYRDYAPIRFFGSIGITSLLSGLVLATWVFILFLLTKRVEHLPTAILSVLLMLTGLQIILFGFLADIFKNHIEK